LGVAGEVELLQPEQGQRAGRRRVVVQAGRAGLADQALGDDQRQRGGHQERLDPHVDQPGDRADRVVGVQRGQHQVAGQ